MARGDVPTRDGPTIVGRFVAWARRLGDVRLGVAEGDSITGDFATFAPACHRAAQFYLCEPDAAWDVVQETFVRALASPPVGEPRQRLSWYRTTARHLAIDELRRRRRCAGPAPDDSVVDALPDPGAADVAGRTLWIRRFVEGLPSTGKARHGAEIFALVFLQGETDADTAARLGLSRPTVVRRKRALRERLLALGEDE